MYFIKRTGASTNADLCPAARAPCEEQEWKPPEERRHLPRNNAYRTLDRELARILEAAGIDLPCREDQEHTPACHLYGFQSFRYAHTRLRFGRVSDRDLQEQIGEASFAATGRHVKQAETHQRRTYEACLPKSLKVKAG